MQLKTIPDLSPLIASDIVCHGCGDIVKPKVIQNKNKTVECLRYTHTNDEVGCRWQIETNVMMTATMVPMREDGTAVRL